MSQQNTQMPSVEEIRQQIIDEMNARRIDHKTYIDSEWLLNEYDKLMFSAHMREFEKILITSETDSYFINDRGFIVDTADITSDK